MAPLVQERVAVLAEVPGMVDFLFLTGPTIDDETWTWVEANEAAPAILQGAVDAYRDCPWSAEALKEATTTVGEAAGLKLGKAQAPIRIAVTGRRVGPPLFESMEVLGRDAVLERVGAVADRLRAG
jgi:glutamyl-tRNA synthetase